MNFFEPELIPFIKSASRGYQMESWGVLIKERSIGFIFRGIKNGQNYPKQLPKGIHFIHIWQDLWVTKPSIITSRISSILGITERIFARNTQVIKLNKAELLHFLNQNHLNVAVNTKHKYGLTLAGKIVAVAAFSASCPVHRNGEVYLSHQLVRFCNKKGVTVVGGLSKLINHFIHIHKTDDIMSYADLDWSNGNSYIKLGFKKIGELPPQPFAVNTITMQRKYKPKLEEINKEWVRFMNQGSQKYLLDLKTNAKR